VFTNRADEPTATGYMNSNGRLGYASHFAGTLVNSAAANLARLQTINGGYMNFGNATNGQVFNLPDAPYDDYVLEVGGASYATLGEFGEIILRSASGFVNGVARRSSHAIRNMSGATDIIVRAEESLRLHYIAGGWRVYSHNYRTVDGAGWEETPHGEVNLDFQFSNATVIPVGENFTYDVDLPVTLAGGQYPFMAQDRYATSVIPLGLANNGSTTAFDSYDITFMHNVATGVTDKVRFTCYNNTSANYAGMGTVYYHGNGVLDYAALGGIGSY
jgi:hypothetical protein